MSQSLSLLLTMLIGLQDASVNLVHRQIGHAVGQFGLHAVGRLDFVQEGVQRLLGCLGFGDGGDQEVDVLKSGDGIHLCAN